MIHHYQLSEGHFSPSGSTPSWIGFAGLFSGILGGLCFPPYDIWPLAWVALVPLCFVLTTPRMTRQVWAGVYLGGLAYHLLALDWLRTSYDASGYSGPYLCGWLIAGQVGALILLLTIAIGRRFTLSWRLPLCWALPIVWVSFEVVRQGTMAIVDGAGTPWFNLAVTQVNFSQIAQVADLGGAYAITFLVAAGNGLLFDLLQYVQRRGQSVRQATGSMAIVALLLIAAFSYGSWRLNQTSTKTGPVCALMGAGDLPPLLLKERLVLRDGSFPDLLIWPELTYHHKMVDIVEGEMPSANNLPPDAAILTKDDAATYGRTVRRYLEDAAREFGAGMLIGCERLSLDGGKGHRFNSLAYADPTNGYQGCYDKRYLVPWSEFIPSDLGWLQVPGSRLYDPGTVAPLFQLTCSGDPAYQFGAAICYDVAFAEHFRHLIRQGPIDFVVLSGSENRDDTGSQSLTLLRMAQLRAIEIRRGIVRNVHRGHSAVIDSSGRLVWVSDREPIDQPLWLPPVPIDRRQSLYGRVGDWPAVGLIVLLTIGGMRKPLSVSDQF
ncbi:MAG: apolipoprotein N-acyltransferase [Aeoliella sp.]